MTIDVFVCGRASDVVRCRDHGRPAEFRCAHALTGRLAGKCCDAAICERCSVEIQGLRYCLPHARLRGAG